MQKEELIAGLDRYYEDERPSSINLVVDDGTKLSCRVIHSETPRGLYEQVDPDTERIPTAREVMQLRVQDATRVFDDLFPDLVTVDDAETLDDLVRTILSGRTDIMENLSDIWKIRLTTSTHMVRSLDSEGNDTVFFYNGEPFASKDEKAEASSGSLSDGGIRYSESALRNIQEGSTLESRLTYQEYLDARGGNFTGTEFLKHPIFGRAAGDIETLRDYVWTLQILDLAGFYNRGLHSGWRPGEMKQGYGRPIALGFKGEAFYPPNNSTVNHSALLLPRETETA